MPTPILAQPEIGPGPFLVALDQVLFSKQLQVAGNTRLRLTQDLREIAHRQVNGCKKRQKAKASRLARRFQHINQLSSGSAIEP